MQWRDHAAPRSATATATLVLIGDPKQAIYAFRGADVYAYIEAARTRRRGGHADDELAQRPGPDRRLRRALRRREARARGDRLPRGRAPRTAAPRLLGAPEPAPLRIRVVPRDAVGLTRQGLRAARARARSTSPATSRPTSCALLRSGAEIDGEGQRPPRPHRRARAHEPQRLARPRRARGRRRPRRHQRRGQRLRHRRRPRVAARCSRRSSALLPAARPLRRADHVPRLDDRAGRRAPTTTPGRACTGACITGRACCA